MASGDLTASTPVIVKTEAAMKVAVDALNLALATDRLVVVPFADASGNFLIFKVLRES